MLQSCRTSPPVPQVFQFSDTISSQFWAKQNHSIESKMQVKSLDFNLPQFETIAKEVATGTQKDSSKLAEQIAEIYRPVLTFDSLIASDNAMIKLHIEVAGDKIKTDLDVWNLLTERSVKQTQTIAQPASEPMFMGSLGKLIAYVIALMALGGACYIVIFKTNKK